MNKKIFLAVTVTALAALVFVSGCRLEINDPVREFPIVRPYISEHPKSASFNVQSPTYAAWDELKVVVQGWVAADGVISYQWYTFEDFEEYCTEPVGGTPIPYATGPAYFPAIEDDLPGKVYYYYVVVTNDYPDATDEKRASIQSDIAIISFYDNSMAPYPVITRPPANATYTIGRTASVTPLEVRATGNTLTYEWYTNTAFNIKEDTATRIDKADFASFMPEITTLKRGENYFFVKVINTVEGKPAATVILPVMITMLPSERAAAPRITQQPQNQLIFTTETARNLTVDAVSSDNGTITLQWYSVTKAAPTSPNDNVFAGETLLKSAAIDDKNFLPPLPITNGSTAYYYVKVINTNTEVIDQTKTTAELKSNIVTVKVAESGTRNTTATIAIPNPGLPGTGNDNRFQYIRGYGGMDVPWANFPNTTKADTELQYNPEWGLGYNILRIMIVPPGTTQGNYTNHEDLVLGRPAGDNQQGWEGVMYRRNGRPDYINNVKVVNDYGGYVLASPWSPPKEWKTNNSINSGGHLMPSEYVSFANYLRSFCQFMYYQGAPVYAVSIANEPNYAGGYDGCEWEPNQMRDFFLKVGQFTQGARGFGGGKSIPRVLIVNGESANNPNINNAVLNDATTRGAVDFYARHVYGAQMYTLWDNQGGYASWKDNSPYQTECWMTEHNINGANPLAFYSDSTWDYIWRYMNDIDLVIRLNNENAFVWWASKRFYSMIGDGQYDAPEGQVLPRGYGLSHFAKYTNGFTRIKFDLPSSGTLIQHGVGTVSVSVGGTGGNVNMIPVKDPEQFTNDRMDVKITAYISQDGNEISMVMYTPTQINGDGGYDLGTVKIDLFQGFDIGSVQAVKSYRTKSGGNDVLHMMEPYDVTVSSDRHSAYLTLNRSEILSVKFTRKP
jgi:O-glycosyl hydrolase